MQGLRLRCQICLLMNYINGQNYSIVVVKSYNSLAPLLSDYKLEPFFNRIAKEVACFGTYLVLPTVLFLSKYS
ncbi:MAG: hypothetical protein ACI9RO_001428 [Alteromonas macleodii]|jgi:hypothetical protein